MQGRQGEAVSIQLGQPYSEGIRSVIQPLPGTREGQSRHYQRRESLKQDVCSQHGFASLVGPIRSSGSKHIRVEDEEHLTAAKPEQH